MIWPEILNGQFKAQGRPCECDPMTSSWAFSGLLDSVQWGLAISLGATACWFPEPLFGLELPNKCSEIEHVNALYDVDHTCRTASPVFLGLSRLGAICRMTIVHTFPEMNLKYKATEQTSLFSRLLHRSAPQSRHGDSSHDHPPNNNQYSFWERSSAK
jgi:hypothetical protein